MINFKKTFHYLKLGHLKESNKFQKIGIYIISLACLVFVFSSWVSYKILNYSYNSEMNLYNDSYLASIYANKIKCDIYVTRLYSLYSVTNNISMITEVNAAKKELISDINNYKSLHNLTDEEKDIIDQLEATNDMHFKKLDDHINKIKNTKKISSDEIQELMDFGKTSVDKSDKLLNYANKYYENMNDKVKKLKWYTIRGLTIINILMICLFALIILIINKINRKMDYYAFYSCVTGLPNKNYVLNTLVSDIKKIDKYAVLVSVDLDNFKAVNDTLGHSAGDELLRLVGRRFKKVVGFQDCVCHIGGDEFLFLIKSVSDKYEAQAVVRKIQEVFKKPFLIGNNEVNYVTASVGVSSIPKDGREFEVLFNCADDAMYLSKKNGKGGYTFYDKDIVSDVYDKAIKKKSIQDGIKNGEFKVFYQPKISSDNKFVGAEALVRWIKDNNVIIPPSEFIEFAENEGLIKYIGEVVITEVCGKIRDWINKGYKNFRIAVNLSADQLINENSCNKVLDIIKTFNIPYEYIEFEVTESMIIKNLSEAIKNIKKFRDCGIKISLDDFGTGYSSLNYLRTLPIDSVKIDKSFIDNIGLNDDSNVMVDTIIKLSHYFKCETVAEGVEEKEQVDCLKDLNCDIFQGYYFGKPMDDVRFEKQFLKQN